MTGKINVLRITLLLPLLFLTGCFKQDYSICPPESNVKLDFRLTGEEDFRANVASVNAYIYDATGNYVGTEQLDKGDLDNHQGMTVLLDPGKYRMVFWANMGTNTLANRYESVAGDIRYSAICYNDLGIVTSDADRLWYGPCTGQRSEIRGIPQEYYTLTVPEEGSCSDVVWFTYAYRSLEIYVKGIETLPTLDIEELPEELGFLGMSVEEQTVTASHGTAWVEEGGTDYAATTFDTLFFEDTAEGDIAIVIRNAAGAELYRTSLADAIVQSGADPSGRVIQLVFTFLHGNVSVTIPSWNSTNPGFEF
jgi:hypothetical protein